MTTLTVHDTTTWPIENFDWPNITACLQKLVDRFPDDLTLDGALMDIAHGRQTLWVVRDRGVTVSVVLSAIEENRHTGHVRGVIRDMGGDRAFDALPLIEEIHEWARQRGATEMDVYGRKGWQRALIPYGYDLVAVVLRKRL